MPDNGFWVVITSAGAPGLTTVEFYDPDSHLIYKERLKDIRLDVNKRKTRKLLNRTLQTVLAAWERNRQPLKEQNIVAACIHR